MMPSNYLPPLEPIGDFRSYVCGNVVIDQTAAIAAGVLIQADQGGRVTIAAGVCIGMGTVIHAQDGLLEIGAGANLGAGVLVYGSSKIGEGACIGASSSIVRSVIAKGAIVPPCSLISDAAESVLAKEAGPAIAEKSFEYAAQTVQIDEPITDNSINPQHPESTEFTEFTEHIEQGVASSVTPELQELNLEPELNSDPSFDNFAATPQDQPQANEPDLAALISINSVQAKAHAQAQINRYIKRLQIN